MGNLIVISRAFMGNLISSWQMKIKEENNNIENQQQPGEHIQIVENQQQPGEHIQIVKLEVPPHARRYKYPSMIKFIGDFKLDVIRGEFIVLHGHKSTGKTTFIRMLAGLLDPDSVKGEMPEYIVSYKPQKINPVSRSTVRHLLQQRIRDSYIDPQFVSDVMQPLLIESLLDQQVVNLSYEECQRVELCLCLGKPADIYLIDEPSAYLNREQKMVAAEVIKSFIRRAKKTACVAEHDLFMQTDLADRVISFQGEPTIYCRTNKPTPWFVNLGPSTVRPKNYGQKRLLG